MFLVRTHTFQAGNEMFRLGNQMVLFGRDMILFGNDMVMFLLGQKKSLFLSEICSEVICFCSENIR